MIKAIIFDLDGVITDTAEFHYQAWKALANKYSMKFDREMNEDLRGVSRMDSLNIILKANNVIFSNEEKEEMAKDKNDLYVEFIEQITPKNAFDGIEELLENLKAKGIKIALGSASKNAMSVIEKLGLKNKFSVIGDGYSVARSKPAPDIFLYAAEKMGMNPADCIVVEDAEAGIEAAITAGMKTIGIGDAERVTKADYIYRETKEIEIDKILF